MSEIIYQKSYQEYKAELDTELNKAAESFVKIGYLLKVARDTNILYESPYGNVNEFAKAEYGIDKTQVSRFIHINDRFSEGGYSDRLQEQYKGFGHAKLTIMLQLPDAINEVLTPEYSKSEIQTIKEEVDREKEITDIEVALEEKEELLDDILYETIKKLGEENPELYVKIHKGVKENGWTIEMLQSTMAPSGEKIYTIRIPGIGRKMLSLKDSEQQIALIDIRQNEKSIYTWDDLRDCWQQLIDTECEPEKNWEVIYGTEFPKKEKIAPVQPQKEASKKKETKVTKAKPKKKKLENRINTKNEADFGLQKEKEEKTEVKIEENVDFTENEEQLPGQMNVDDYPELKPDNLEENESAPPAAVIENDTDQLEVVENLPEAAPESRENVDFALSEVDSEAIKTDGCYRGLVTEYATLISNTIKEQPKPVPLGVLDKCIKEARNLLRLLENWREDRDDEETN